MGTVIDLSARSGRPDGGANRACPTCGGEWWSSPGVVIDADTGSVTGYAYPLTCVECGATTTGP